jgi:hypothetical protein
MRDGRKFVPTGRMVEFAPAPEKDSRDATVAMSFAPCDELLDVNFILIIYYTIGLISMIFNN